MIGRVAAALSQYRMLFPSDARRPDSRWPGLARSTNSVKGHLRHRQDLRSAARLPPRLAAAGKPGSKTALLE